MDRETIDMELTPRERSQLLRYGYPFARIKAALEAHSDSKRTEVLPLDRFELERLIGDLSYTINHMEPGTLQDPTAKRTKYRDKPHVATARLLAANKLH